MPVDHTGARSLVELARFLRFQRRMLVALVAFVALVGVAQWKHKPPFVVHALLLVALGLGLAMLVGTAVMGWRMTRRRDTGAR